VSGCLEAGWPGGRAWCDIDMCAVHIEPRTMAADVSAGVSAGVSRCKHQGHGAEPVVHAKSCSTLVFPLLL
jgi:hypothetical protein